MSNLEQIKQRYMQDGVAVRLGGISANLARLVSFSRHSANKAAAYYLLTISSMKASISSSGQPPIPIPITRLSWWNCRSAWRAGSVTGMPFGIHRSQIADRANGPDLVQLHSGSIRASNRQGRLIARN